MNETNKLIDNITLAALLLLNFGLKFLFISSNAIGGDEPFSIYHAQMNIPSIIQNLIHGNNPPFYEILLHFWIKVFGISALSVRFPSLIFSVLTVYFIFRLAKVFFSYRVALIACLLYSFSTYHILFAHEARVYALFALLTAMSMYYYLKIYSEPKTLKYYLFLLATNVLLIYSHYFGFFVLVIQTVALLGVKNIGRQTAAKYALYLLILVLLYSPNFNNLIVRFLDSSSNGTWVRPPNGIESIYNMLWQFSNRPITTVLSILVLLVAFVKMIVKKDYKNISPGYKFIFFWFLFPFLFMFVVSYWIPMFMDRYLIFVSLAYYLALAICANYIIKVKKYSLVLPAILIGFFVITVNPDVDNKRRVKDTVAKITALKGENSLVLICPQHFVLNYTYYAHPEIFKDVDNEPLYTKMLNRLQEEDVYALNSLENISLAHFSTILYLDAAADFSYPNNNIIPTLEKNFQLKQTHKYYEIFTIYEFIRKTKPSIVAPAQIPQVSSH